MNKTVGIDMYTHVLKAEFVRVKTKVDNLDAYKINTFTTDSTLIRLGIFENSFFFRG